jgi:hypothetical protein
MTCHLNVDIYGKREDLTFTWDDFYRVVYYYKKRVVYMDLTV